MTPSRDLLQRFTSGSGGNRSPVKPKEEQRRPDNIELSLGLSLIGRFSPEPQRSVNFPADGELSLCSQPPETEAERRKRKQLLRLEAKRKRVEKVKNVNVVKRCRVLSSSDETMPFVSTKGDGPDGKRVQGFLYRYGEDEEVRIVCVCHGSFLTPAEFVKHGGGGDVEHPLRHIVVTSLLS